ncbi:MAG: translation elongation factor Ts [Nitrospinota bacterium]|nr:translation elongation factor Ts [Nitrospinota bacterium]MDH5756354.1 translation elongation factor Ts [Nitrospinota bacterium]
MTVTMDMIKDLRQRTGAGIMECKEALRESDGDIEAATQYLRKKGVSKAAKKADRNTKEGAVRTVVDGAIAAMVEVKCETDFVARNDKFQEFTSNLTEHTAGSDFVEGDEEFLAQPYLKDKSKTVKDILTAMISEIGENIVVGRRVHMKLQGPGLLASYVHGVGNIGVLLELGADSDNVAQKPEVANLARDLTMQIAAMRPIALNPDEIPQEIIDREKEVFAAQARESGKPEQIIPKIVEGSLKKFFTESCLPMQAFVKDNKKTIEALIKEVSSTVGGQISIRRFFRYELGE